MLIYKNISITKRNIRVDKEYKNKRICIDLKRFKTNSLEGGETKWQKRKLQKRKLQKKQKRDHSFKLDFLLIGLNLFQIEYIN